MSSNLRNIYDDKTDYVSRGTNDNVIIPEAALTEGELAKLQTQLVSYIG
jgi:hypothetical protein